MAQRPRLLFLSISLLMAANIHADSDENMASLVARWHELETVKPNRDDVIERRPVISGRTLDLAVLDVFSQTLATGAAAPAREYKQSREELLIVKEGKLEVTVSGRSQTLGPGSVAVTYPGEARTIENAGDAPATYFLFTYRTRRSPDMARGRNAGGSLVIDWDDVEYRSSDIGGRRNFFDRPTAMFDTFEMHVSTQNEGLTNHPAHTYRPRNLF